MKALIISHPLASLSGGGKRSYETLRHFPQFIEEVVLILSPQTIIEIIKSSHKNPQQFEELMNSLKLLEIEGITVDKGSIKFIHDEMVNIRTKNNKSIDIIAYFKRLFPYVFYRMLIWKYLKKYFSEICNVDFIYSQHETLDSIMLTYIIAKKLNKPFIILLQLEPFRNIEYIVKKKIFNNFFEIVELIPEISLNYSKKIFYKKLIKSKFFKGFLSVSIAPLDISKLYSTPYIILDPGNAFNASLLNFREEKVKKENCAIYFGRITPEKGIFDLPYIWKGVVREIPKIKLYIFGSGHEKHITLLKKTIDYLNLDKNIIIKGFIVDQNELNYQISKSKLFVYPSYSDAFPLGILECLAIGTPVVSYDIPAIISKYNGFKAVKIVEQGDIRSFSCEIIKIINLNELIYYEMIEQPELNEFLIHQSSWKNVVCNEIESINTLLIR